jgi:hypothetical protein
MANAGTTLRKIAFWTIKIIALPFIIVVIVLDQWAELTGA